MNTIALQRLGLSLTASTTLLTACVDKAPVGPDRGATLRAAAAASSAAAQVGGAAAARNDNRTPDLGACQNLRAPAGSKLAYHVYATGVQIYHWTGTSWAFDGPSAILSADAGGRSTVGIHYAGPTWESVSGGTVVGTVQQRCTPDPNAIPWLLLSAVSDGPGVLHHVTFVQRVNTVGGNAPSSPGNVVGAEARVPYSAEYFFYRAP
jgi:hypothetical protein